MSELRKNEQQSRYELVQGAEVLGYAEYQMQDSAVVLPHTEVDSAHAGEGIGSQLAQFALNDIQASGKQVIPSCPFIAKYIENHPQYQGLVQS